MKRKTPSLRRNLLRAVLTPVVVLASGATGYAVVSHLPATVVMAEPEAAAPAPAPAPAPTPAERLIKRHDCWTGEAPADVDFPGHVVLTLKNGKTVYDGSLGVEAALQHVFDGPLPGIKTVHAFCR